MTSTASHPAPTRHRSARAAGLVAPSVDGTAAGRLLPTVHEHGLDKEGFASVDMRAPLDLRGRKGGAHGNLPRVANWFRAMRTGPDG